MYKILNILKLFENFFYLHLLKNEKNIWICSNIYLIIQSIATYSYTYITTNCLIYNTSSLNNVNIVVIETICKDVKLGSLAYEVY